jgi:hypothetical protein
MARTLKQSSEALPLPDACRAARISYRAGWQAVVDGRVPAKRQGRRWLVAPAELAFVLRGARKGATTVSLG